MPVFGVVLTCVSAFSKFALNLIEKNNSLEKQNILHSSHLFTNLKCQIHDNNNYAVRFYDKILAIHDKNFHLLSYSLSFYYCTRI